MIPHASYYEPTESTREVLRQRVEAAIEGQQIALRDKLPLYRARIEVAGAGEQVAAGHIACDYALRAGWQVKMAGRRGGPIAVVARGPNDARCMDLSIETEDA